MPPVRWQARILRFPKSEACPRLGGMGSSVETRMGRTLGAAGPRRGPRVLSPRAGRWCCAPARTTRPRRATPWPRCAALTGILSTPTCASGPAPCRRPGPDPGVLRPPARKALPGGRHPRERPVSLVPAQGHEAFPRRRMAEGRAPGNAAGGRSSPWMRKTPRRATARAVPRGHPRTALRAALGAGAAGHVFAQLQPSRRWRERAACSPNSSSA